MLLRTPGAETGAELSAAEPALPFAAQFSVLELCVPACRRQSQGGSCPGSVGCHTKAESHPGRTLQEQQGCCCHIAPWSLPPCVQFIAVRSVLGSDLCVFLGSREVHGQLAPPLGPGDPRWALL